MILRLLLLLLVCCNAAAVGGSVVVVGTGASAERAFEDSQTLVVIIHKFRFFSSRFLILLYFFGLHYSHWTALFIYQLCTPQPGGTAIPKGYILIQLIILKFGCIKLVTVRTFGLDGSGHLFLFHVFANQRSLKAAITGVVRRILLTLLVVYQITAHRLRVQVAFVNPIHSSSVLSLLLLLRKSPLINFIPNLGLLVAKDILLARYNSGLLLLILLR